MSTDYISDPGLGTHLGFVLAEEAALKHYLSGLTVPSRDAETNIEIPVWFRWPESERRMSYPFITIDLLSISPAYDRFTSIYNAAQSPMLFEGYGTNPDRWGVYYPGYESDVQFDSDKTYYIERYLPYNLMFQISTFARSAYHDRYMTSRFITDIIPPRGEFWIDVEADHGARRCEMVQWVSGDTMETGEAAKRIFRKIYTVLMETEIPVSKIIEGTKIDTVHIDYYDNNLDGAEDVEHPVDAPHNIAMAESTYNAAG